MRLTSMAVENFRSFYDRTNIAFQNGAYVVLGENADEGYSSNGCLAGDMLIEVPRNCREQLKGVPIKELVGTAPLVYAYNLEEHRIDLAQASRVWCSGVKKTYRVVLKCVGGAGSGTRFRKQITELVATSNHPVLMRDNSWRSIESLQVGDLTMPFYRYTRDGKYLHLRTLLSDESDSRIVGRFLLGNEIPEGYHVHHKNKETWDNRPGNLAVLSLHDHLAYHSRQRPPYYEEHPRGFLGRSHTTASREKTSRTLRSRIALLECKECGGVFEGYFRKRFCSTLCRSRSRNRKVRYMNHRVVSVEYVGESPVYDMEVPGYSNFIANGVIVHNSGKTSLLAAIPWALYGKLATGADKDQVISRGGNDVMVSLRFGDDLVVSRIKKRSKSERLTFDHQGKTVDGDLDVVQAKLNAVLGLSSRLFFNGFWLDKDSSSVQFVYARPAERQKILEELVSEGMYAELRKRVSKKRTVLEGERNTLAQRVEDGKAHLLDMATALKTALAMLEAQKSRAEVDRLALARKVKSLTAEYEITVAAQGEATRAYKSVMDKLTKYKGNERMVERLEGDLRRMEQDLKGLVMPDGQALCPTCKQPIGTSDNRMRLLSRIAELKAQRDTLRQQLIQYHQYALEAQQLELDRADLEEKRDAAAAEYMRVRMALDNAKDLQVDVAIPTATLEHVQDLKKKIKSRKDEMDRWQARLLELDAEIPDYSFLVDAFGSKGIPNLLLDDLRQLLNHHTAVYTERLCGKSLSVTFPISEKGLEIRVTTPTGQAPIECFSRGEVWRANMAVLLALYKTVQQLATVQIDLLILDDPIGDLDEAGEEVTYDFCREIAGMVSNVFVTVPRDPDDPRGFHVVKVVKENGRSRVA